MNIEEAIEELRKDTEHPTAGFMPDLQRAQRLGIEALERIKEARLVALADEFALFDLLMKPLPSEEE